jgi:uncharacterized membrane protein YphA (DoxX/SURF4 family)
MQIGFMIGRIILGVYYLYSGIAGLTHVQMLAGYAASKGVPAAGLAVIVAHLLLIVAGLCFLTGYKPVWGVIAAVIFFLPVTFFMHAFWMEKTAQLQQVHLINFTKNFALLGANLMFLAIPQPWRYSLRAGAGAGLLRRAPA